MRRGERFLLDVFEGESTDAEYRFWTADDASPAAGVTTRPERYDVCMPTSGLEFRCATLGEAEREIAICKHLGL
ncbi:hypothetical protein [Amnibacterium kyonggiense]